MSDIHSKISEYLEQHRIEILTDEFGFATYNSPNTMYSVGNHVDELVLRLSPAALRMWHRCLSLLRRNTDPVLACSFIMKLELFEDIVTRNAYFKGKKELIRYDLILPTKDNKLYIVNIKHANKLYKPKL